MSDQAPAEVIALAVERVQARADKDWARSDELRDAIAAASFSPRSLRTFSSFPHLQLWTSTHSMWLQLLTCSCRAMQQERRGMAAMTTTTSAFHRR